MKLVQVLAAATLTVSSICAFATPVYISDTDATNITNNQMDTGFYIWNDEQDTRKWSVRWTSQSNSHLVNNGPGPAVSWWGSVEFLGGSFETPASANDLKVSFESNDALGWQQNSWFGPDAIAWNAYTNNSGGVDGIDFTVDSDVEALRFNLGSSLNDELALHSGSTYGVAGSEVFIGDGFAQPNVWVVNDNNGRGNTQTFEVTVPEPDTLALLGLGLAGLGFARRRQAKA